MDECYYCKHADGTSCPLNFALVDTLLAFAVVLWLICKAFRNLPTYITAKKAENKRKRYESYVSYIENLTSRFEKTKSVDSRFLPLLKFFDGIDTGDSKADEDFHNFYHLHAEEENGALHKWHQERAELAWLCGEAKKNPFYEQMINDSKNSQHVTNQNRLSMFETLKNVTPREPAINSSAKRRSRQQHSTPETDDADDSVPRYKKRGLLPILLSVCNGFAWIAAIITLGLHVSVVQVAKEFIYLDFSSISYAIHHLTVRIDSFFHYISRYIGIQWSSVGRHLQTIPEMFLLTFRQITDALSPSGANNTVPVIIIPVVLIVLWMMRTIVFCCRQPDGESPRSIKRFCVEVALLPLILIILYAFFNTPPNQALVFLSNFLILSLTATFVALLLIGLIQILRKGKQPIRGIPSLVITMLVLIFLYILL